MFLWVLTGFFAAFGLLCAGLVLLGAVLSRERGGVFLLDPEQSDGMYFLWLRAMGIVRCGIYRVTDPALWRIIREHTEELSGWDGASRT